MEHCLGFRGQGLTRLAVGLESEIERRAQRTLVKQTEPLSGSRRLHMKLRKRTSRRALPPATVPYSGRISFHGLPPELV